MFAQPGDKRGLERNGCVIGSDGDAIGQRKSSGDSGWRNL
jgi:hypothetical protein